MNTKGLWVAQGHAQPLSVTKRATIHFGQARFLHVGVINEEVEDRTWG